MMKKSMFAMLACVPLLVTADDMKHDMFPETLENGAVKHVFVLPELDEGEMRKVAIIVSKEMEVDCNVRGLPGAFEQLSLQGWGYSMYEFTLEEIGATTMMACPEPAHLQTLEQSSELYRYNDKLPLVVYAPEGVEVRHQIWAPVE